MSSEDLEISVVGDRLTIRGARQHREAKEDEVYHRQERSNGEFTRTLQLPFMVDPGKVNARLSKGVLWVTLPRAEADKPKKIKVNSA